MIVALFARWGAVVWRARGGGLAALAHVKFGTQATRLACGLLLAVPCAVVARDWWLLGIAPDILVGLIVSGWAAFMAYGADGNAHVLDSPFDWLPRAAGVPQKSQWTDAIGFFEIGPACMGLTAALLAWRGYAWWWAIVPTLAFAPVYYVADTMGARRWLPYWPAVDTEEAWAELTMGAVIGAALALAIGA